MKAKVGKDLNLSVVCLLTKKGSWLCQKGIQLSGFPFLPAAKYSPTVAANESCDPAYQTFQKGYFAKAAHAVF